ncbi:hypothetical protein HY338_00740, partial [Candidatus Gottesmanbacteria bacterium]|nr:hypothetical protein [Candidatus Gottesmanbacteria bacterium]
GIAGLDQNLTAPPTSLPVTNSPPDFARAFAGIAGLDQNLTAPPTSLPVTNSPPDFARAFAGIAGLDGFNLEPISSEPQFPGDVYLPSYDDLQLIFDRSPQPVLNTSAVNTTRASSAGERAGEFVKGVGEKIWNNKEFLASFAAGLGITLSMAEGLHQPNLALSFPALTAALGEVPIALTTLYKAALFTEQQRINQPKGVLSKLLLVPNITQEKIDRLEKWPHRRLMNWITDKVSNLTYRKVIHGLTTGGMTGLAITGAMELNKMHQAQANQAAAASPLEQQNLDAMKNSDYHRASSNAPWSPTVAPVKPPQSVVTPASALSRIPAEDLLSDLSGSSNSTDVVQSVVNQIKPSITVEAARESNSVWAASKNWLQPLTDHLKLTPQAQTYFTDAVKDVMEKYYRGLQPGQTIDFKSHIGEIINYVQQAIKVNSPNIAGGGMDPSLKGLTVSDLQPILSKGLDLLKLIPK